MDQDDVEQESGVASNGSANASGGETNGGSGEENSSYFWSSSNSYDDSGPDLSGEDELAENQSVCLSEGYVTDTSHPSGHVRQPPTTLHWVRMSSLRIHDNASLSEAMLNSKNRFRAVFIIDPWFASGERKFGVNRWRFLLECLHDLDKRLKTYNTRLYVAKGHPLAVLDKLCTRWNVSELTFQQDREVRSHILEESIEKLAEQLDIKVTKRQGHTLYDTAKLLERVGDRQIATIKDFKEVLHLVGKPDLPVETPPVPITSYEEHIPEEYRIPTLQDLGFPAGECLYSNTGGWIGGETMALRRLVEYCKTRSKQQAENYVDLLFDKTSLSPYIRFGCLSVRYFLSELKRLAGKDSSMEALVKDVTGKLLQREFYFTVAKQVPNLDCYDNSISFQLPWEDDSHLFTLWKNGRTGYPWIDAAMRQLQKEGWIHLCLRESVASFLTRGDLWINWVLGKDTFEEMMLDFEVAVSSGCWMKSSCSAFITGPVEHFCPVSYGRQIDPTGVYIRAFCPELKHYPDEYIYCPWMAPIEVQRSAGCLIGVDYPNPIIDHSTAGFLCCEKLRTLMGLVHNQAPPPARKRPANPHHQPHQSVGLWVSTLQTFLDRYHPYSQNSHPERIRILDSDSVSSLLNRPRPVEKDCTTGKYRRRNCESVDSSYLCSSEDSSGVLTTSKSCCTTCTSTDNLMTQLLLGSQGKGRTSSQQQRGRLSSSSPPRRERQISPPSICSHKHANFAVLT